MHDLLCLVRLLETDDLPTEIRTKLLKALHPIVERMVIKTEAEWYKYGLKPLDIVTTPESPFASLFPHSIQENLDYVIAQQAENGSWEPNWSWGGLYPQAWEKARQAWSGVLTIKNLKLLWTYGRYGP